MKASTFKRNLVIVAIILFVGAFVVEGVAQGTTIYVDDDNTGGPWDGTLEHPYQHIQDGINNASSGDTVYVFNGIYTENVVVDRRITLTGEDQDSTVIDGGGSGHVVIISAAEVNISGFTIQNSGSAWGDAGIYATSDSNTITGNNITYNEVGICLYDSLFYSHNNNIITGNIIRNNNWFGIFLWYSSNSVILGNTIADNVGEGIDVFASDNNNIYENEITGHHWGIFLDSGVNNSIYGNTIANNTSCGIDVFYSDRNNISENDIRDNSKGIQVEFIDCNNNIIYHNNFIDNTQNAYDEFNNNWDDGYPSGGNYWSDFDEPGEGAYDNNGDGIVDSAYNIPGNSNRDRYPLMNPWDGTPPTPNCGDANANGDINLADAVFLVNYLFIGGPEPIPHVCVGDCNADGTSDLADVVCLVNYLFIGGPPPASNCCSDN